MATVLAFYECCEATRHSNLGWWTHVQHASDTNAAQIFFDVLGTCHDPNTWKKKRKKQSILGSRHIVGGICSVRGSDHFNLPKNKDKLLVLTQQLHLNYFSPLNEAIEL